ncbi:hypothetical protein WJX72_002882 [[Myrmecia] bisecta]|uniref:ABC transporter domain-containing protein n=1 Tax=[Myrmecia] bisecta TaxID=41462 RepID=A0AAW1QPM7_9CHLO
MTAIVGPSGAGKSTLLDILSARLLPSSGTVLVDGMAPTKHFRSIATFIPQEDNFVPTLSVWETLNLHISLRMQLPEGKAHALMESSLSSMGLLKVKNSQVGGILPGGLSVRGLSGGERRRLNIACGVVASPAICCLDEPTSGLDSHAALVVMQHLQRMAASRRSIICTVHQPRPAIWEMFTSITVLAEGRMLFMGPAAEVLSWFSGVLGFSFAAEHDGSPSDWLMDIINIGFQEHGGSGTVGKGLTTLQQVQDAAARFRAKRLPAYVAGLPQDTTGAKHVKLAVPSNGNDSQAVVAIERTYPTSWFNQLRVLYWRAVLGYLRNPLDVMARLLLSLTVGILVGITFLNATKGHFSVQYRMNVLFTTVFGLVLIPFAHMTVYVHDKLFFVADMRANLYQASAYYVAQTLAGLPFVLLNGMIQLLATYALVGLRNTASAILGSALLCGLHSLNGVQLLAWSSYMMPNHDLAFVNGVGYVTCCILLTGYLVRIMDLVAPLRILSYIFPLRMVYCALVRLQFEGTTEGAQVLHPSETNPYDIMLSVGQNVAILLGINASLHVLAFAALWRLQYTHR